VTAAIFGLVGVVVGALATGGTQLYLEWRRERLAFKRAKRLIAAELLHNAVSFKAISDYREVAPFKGGFPVATSAWEDGRADLLRLDDDLFALLAQTYGLLVLERGRLDAAIAASKVSSTMATDFAKSAKHMRALRERLLS
jgi:hypothetical protein